MQPSLTAETKRTAEQAVVDKSKSPNTFIILTLGDKIPAEPAVIYKTVVLQQRHIKAMR